MRIFRRRIVLAAVVLLVAGAAVGAWLLTRGGAAAAATSTTTVSTQTVRTTVAASGTLEPSRQADLDFEVSGTVVQVLVEAGDRVRKGQALARVDDDALVAARVAAAATLDAARTQLAEDQDSDASDTQLAADQTAIVAARASLTDAQQDVTDAALRATIAGTVTDVTIQKGDVLDGGSTTAGTGMTGTTTNTTTSSDDAAAVSIVSTGSFEVDATVAAADIDQIKDGLQVELTVSGVDDTVYGTVSSVGRVAQTDDSGAAVFPVTIQVTGKQKDLYAGTSADAEIIVQQRQGVLVVSTPAVQSKDGKTYVDRVVEEKTGRTEQVQIKIGETYGLETEVLSGLSEGDVVEVPGFTRGAGGGGQGDNGFPGGGDFQPPEGFTPPAGEFPGGGGQ